jgi:hypothetical protein
MPQFSEDELEQWLIEEAILANYHQEKQEYTGQLEENNKAQMQAKQLLEDYRT